jgi:hypothetical protein
MLSARPLARSMRRLSLLLALTVSTLSEQALAYVHSQSSLGRPLRWESPCVTLYAQQDELPAPLTAEVVLRAARGAARVWSRPALACTELSISARPSPEPVARASQNGRNEIVFLKDKWCRQPDDPAQPCYDRRTLAVTTVLSRKEDGSIVEADIEVNAVDYRWRDLSERVGDPTAQDLQTVLTHELGHLIGLNHTCAEDDERRMSDHTGKEVPYCTAASPALRGTIMYPSHLGVAAIRRILSTDDARAACGIYPMPRIGACRFDAPDAGPRDAAPRGDGSMGDGGMAGAEPAGCAMGARRGGPSRGLASALAAIGVALLLRRRRRRRV